MRKFDPHSELGNIKEIAFQITLQIASCLRQLKLQTYFYQLDANQAFFKKSIGYLPVNLLPSSTFIIDSKVKRANAASSILSSLIFMKPPT
jgi:hypothetical protein